MSEMRRNWYEDRRYQRFWAHYNASMNWSRRHRVAYWRARALADQYENNTLRHYLSNLHTGTDSKLYYDHQNRYTNKPQEYAEEAVEEEEEGEVVMEITDEMLEFLEKSDRHREQLKAQRASMEENNYDDNDEKDLEAPPEKPGLQRSTEMIALYGLKSAMIQAMETAVQLSYNRNCDYNQPKYWPNLPLKL